MRGSNCLKEIEIKGRLDGFRQALVAKLVSDNRFQEIFADVHFEIFGMTVGAKSLAIGVAGQQLTTKDWRNSMSRPSCDVDTAGLPKAQVPLQVLCGQAADSSGTKG